jgi:hypothetical protein
MESQWALLFRLGIASLPVLSATQPNEKILEEAMRLEQWLKELEVERNRVCPKVLNQDIHLLGRGPQSYLANSLVVFHGVEVLLGTS